MDAPRQYLIAVGRAGQLGHYLAPAIYQRGDRVLVQTDHGQELGEVLQPVAAGEAPLAYRPPPGEVLRRWTPADDLLLTNHDEIAEQLLAAATDLAADLSLPLQVLDVEPVLEPKGFVLHLLRFAEADLRPWVSQLSRQFDAYLHLLDVTDPNSLEDAPGCGSCGSSEGGCGSCGEGGGCGSEGGGCSTGCGSKPPGEFERDWQAYFAELRQGMDRRIGLPM